LAGTVAAMFQRGGEVEVMNQFKIVADIPEEMKSQLEELLFFHPHQGRMRLNILDSVHSYGSPRIVTRAGRLHVAVGEMDPIPALYAVSTGIITETLLGVLLFTRHVPDTLEVMHVVVHPDYTAAGAHDAQGVFMALIDQLRRIAHGIKGINQVHVFYWKGQNLPLKPLDPHL
jgi:hypothetical protein